MRRIAWTRLAALALAAFFVVGGIANIAALGGAADEYRRWGYPFWFHYVTGLLELATAGLLVLRRTRKFGLLLGTGLMGAAAATVVVNDEAGHGIPAAIVFVLLVALGLADRR